MEELLQQSLHGLHRDVRCIMCILRGDGSEGNPGIVIKLDRLIQAATLERERRQRTEHRLWGAVSALGVTVVGWLLASLTR